MVEKPAVESNQADSRRRKTYAELKYLPNSELAQLDPPDFLAFLVGYLQSVGKGLPSAAEEHYARTLRSRTLRALFLDSIRHAERA